MKLRNYLEGIDLFKIIRRFAGPFGELANNLKKNKFPSLKAHSKNRLLLEHALTDYFLKLLHIAKTLDTQLARFEHIKSDELRVDIVEFYNTECATAFQALYQKIQSLRFNLVSENAKDCFAKPFKEVLCQLNIHNTVALSEDTNFYLDYFDKIKVKSKGTSIRSKPYSFNLFGQPKGRVASAEDTHYFMNGKKLGQHIGNDSPSLKRSSQGKRVTHSRYRFLKHNTIKKQKEKSIKNNSKKIILFNE